MTGHLPAAAFGVDIGGTWTRIAALPAYGSADQAMTVPLMAVARYPTEADYPQAVNHVVEAIAQSGFLPVRVGVSIAARLDQTGERVTVGLHLRDYEGRAFVADLGEAVGCPVSVAHDATCGLLGELSAGALRGRERCAYLTISTGIGAALRLGTAEDFVVLTTEAGHQIVHGVDEPCLCRQRGCLQTQVGGQALGDRIGRRLEEIADRDFWSDYGRRLAHGLGNIGLIAGVNTIALGGAIALGRPELWSGLADELRRSFTYQPVDVVRAALGSDAPLYGALALADLPSGRVLH